MKVCWVLALLALNLLGAAQAANNNSGAWAIVTANGPLGASDSRWRFGFDGQYRVGDFGSDAYQTVLRPSVTYRLDGGPALTAGYGHFLNHQASGQHVVEHRFWQQVAWTARRFARGSLSMHFRLAQRDVDAGDDLGWWLRYRLRYTHRFSERWQASAFVEPFVDLTHTDWGGDSGMRQHRVFLGVERRVSDALALEVGYLHQYNWVDGRDNVANHLAILSLNTRF